jgi:hypothetical protein
VTDCDPEDIGRYSVVVDNGIDQMEQVAMLNVKGILTHLFLRYNVHHSLIFQVKPNVETLNLINEQSCMIGQETEITWMFSGIEKPQVTWCFNGQPLEINDRFQVTESDDGRSTLTIRRAQFIDEGIYTTRATNSVGEVEAQTTLSIVDIRLVIETDLGADLQVETAPTTTPELTISENPQLEMVCMQANDEPMPNDRACVTPPTVLNVQHEDLGECSAESNSIDESVEPKSCEVTVTGEHVTFYLVL